MIINKIQIIKRNVHAFVFFRTRYFYHICLSGPVVCNPDYPAAFINTTSLLSQVIH